jgi:succinate dehydrogenase / fumarate reductase iron-sulfur subunit
MGLGYCNITKCCTEVCPEHIKITDNAIIPMKERVVDKRYDPLVWLGRKIFRRDQLTEQGAPALSAVGGQPSASAPAGQAGAGKLPVTEFTFDRAGGGSPFGDEKEFPLPADDIDYEHPEKKD